MNYFPFDPDPRLSAIALDDKRLARVFHEAVMMLSKAQYELTGETGPYSPRTPMPRVLLDWVKGAGEAWFVEWTREMLVALVDRNGQVRVSGYACYTRYLQLNSRFRNERLLFATPATFPNLARAAIKGLDFTAEPDTHKAYRDYVRIQWREHDKRPCVWTRHGPPSWAGTAIKDELEELGL